MADSILTDNLTDFETNIHVGIDAHFFYLDKDKELIYKVDVKIEDNKYILNEYMMMPSLGNTLRKIQKTITLKTSEEVIKLLRNWFNEHKENIEIINKSKVKQMQVKREINENNNNINLDEAQIFIDSRSRELNSKYKAVYQWFQETVKDGDKDYAEKVLSVIEKWKKNYEDRIKGAKAIIKESAGCAMTCSQFSSLDKLRVELDERWNVWAKSFFESVKKGLLNKDLQKKYSKKLSDWYRGEGQKISNLRERLNNGHEIDKSLMKIKDFELFNIDDLKKYTQVPPIQEMLENEKIQNVLQDLNKREEEFKDRLKKMDDPDLEPSKKDELIKSMIKDYIELPKRY